MYTYSEIYDKVHQVFSKMTTEELRDMVFGPYEDFKNGEK